MFYINFLARACVPLGVPTGATFVQSRCTQENANYFKDVCTLECVPGYKATNPANTELKCGADSLWEGTLLICKRKYSQHRSLSVFPIVCRTNNCGYDTSSATDRVLTMSIN